MPFLNSGMVGSSDPVVSLNLSRVFNKCSHSFCIKELSGGDGFEYALKRAISFKSSSLVKFDSGSHVALE